MSQTPDAATGADERTPSGLPAWVRDILRCPACRSTLEDVEVAAADGSGPVVALQCTADPCGDLEPGSRRRYRVDDGIPVLLVDDAEVVSA